MLYESIEIMFDIFYTDCFLIEVATIRASEKSQSSKCQLLLRKRRIFWSLTDKIWHINSSSSIWRRAIRNRTFHCDMYFRVVWHRLLPLCLSVCHFVVETLRGLDILSINMLKKHFDVCLIEIWENCFDTDFLLYCKSWGGMGNRFKVQVYTCYAWTNWDLLQARSYD